MSFRILFLPALVYAKIFEQMILKEIFLLSVLSKRTRQVLRSSFATRPVQLTINYYKRFSINKIIAETNEEDDTDEFATMPVIINQLNDLHKFLSSDIVQVAERVEGLGTFWRDEARKFNLAIEHFALVFPKLRVHMEHTASNSEEFSETLRILKNYNVELLKVSVKTPRDIDDQMVKLLLDECRDAKILHVFNKTSPDFQYDLETGGSFNGYEIHIEAREWLTSRNFVDLFMKYKWVNLYTRSFTDDELRIIFTKWIKRSKIREFHIFTINNHQILCVCSGP